MDFNMRYQYFSKWRKEWRDFPKKEQPFIGMRNAINPFRYVELMKKYHYKIRTVLN